MENSQGKDKRCWICLEEKVEDDDSWIAPCYCKGSVKYTHEKCLLRWIYEKQQVDDPVECQSCGYVYVIQEPYNPLLSLMNFINSGINSIVPISVLWLSSVGGYVISSGYGLLVLRNIAGKEGWAFLNDDSLDWQVVVGLPLIPVSLIFSRFPVPDYFFILIPVILFPVNRFTIVFSWPPSPLLVMHTLPWIRLFYKKLHSSFLRWDFEREVRKYSSNGRFQIATVQESESVSVSRLSVGALAFPFLASFVGSFIPSKSLSTFHKSLIGGIIIVFTKDVTSFIYRKIIRKQRRSRKIQNFHQDLEN